VSKVEKERREVRPFEIFFPFMAFKSLEDYLIKYAPERYKEALNHYVNAKIELLKAVDKLIKIRIEELEALKEVKVVKKEKVEVE